MIAAVSVWGRVAYAVGGRRDPRPAVSAGDAYGDGRRPPPPAFQVVVAAGVQRRAVTRLRHYEGMTGTLVLLRHGESEWNAKNLFTGWVDVDLNAKGEAEARRGGELLKEAGLLPDVVHTSLLKRAIRTAQIALMGSERHWVPTRR